MPRSSATRSKKAIVEQARRDLINRKVEMLRDEFINTALSKKISLGEVLNRAALLLNGEDASAPLDLPTSTPGPVRNRKETLKDREQGRRDVQVAGFDALRKYVLDNGLSTNDRLERNELLDIVIAQVKIVMAAAPAKLVILPAPAAPSAAPAVNTPPPAAPAPVNPIQPALSPFVFQFLFLQQYNLLLQKYFQMMMNNNENDENDEEFIDIIN